MSDANGFASGGISDLLEVGPGSSTCNVTLQHPSFVFDLPSPLQQCASYKFNYSSAAQAQPVQIYGIIPGGTAFVLTPPKGPTSYEWVANVPSETTLVWCMTDAQNRSGGCSAPLQVNDSSVSSCLAGAHPSSLATIPSMVPSSAIALASITASSATSCSPITSSAASSAATTRVATTDKTKISDGAIAGIAVGGLLGVVLVALFVGFILFKKYRHPTARYLEDGQIAYRPGRKGDEVDLADDSPPPVVHPYPVFVLSAGLNGPGTSGYSDPPDGDTVHAPSSPIIVLPNVRSNSLSEGLPYAASWSQPDNRTSATSLSLDTDVSGARRKARTAEVPTYAATPQVIVHTDAEDVIESPPQYSDHRTTSQSGKAISAM
ncbi:hypothetical protein WOLCODRAFT_160291 [Wolfiporia cocos MD-104 SS10]|uniref:Mid2 domain-containing protein n=1 Tax=Wolfiporia cocos (strain MD-104) TaxID=742152 RepID=A0A2H3J7V4_WOLCO|nr:hypothetical protein WOLCODRAFT_160291 [Wolfiporia cocos MD-104 SS10]